jgi:GGDEF domain-containing protein
MTALSRRDPLTGLLNRAGFEQFLERQAQAGLGATLGLL